MLVYYIVDIETTGLSVDFHEINQISVQRVADQSQVTYQVKVKNPNSYSPEALQIQGITPADLKKGIPLSKAVENIESFLSEDGKTKAHRCMVAHNAPFDRKFIHRAWDGLDREFPADLWLCTMVFGKRYASKHGSEKIAKAQVDSGVEIKPDKSGKLKPKFGLNPLMIGLGLQPKQGAHSAEVDVQNTLELFNWLTNSGTEYVSLVSRIPHKEEQKPELDISDF